MLNQAGRRVSTRLLLRPKDRLALFARANFTTRSSSMDGRRIFGEDTPEKRTMRIAGCEANQKHCNKARKEIKSLIRLIFASSAGA